MSGSHLTAQAYPEPSIHAHPETSEAARVLVRRSWDLTTDRAARTANGRRANWDRFLKIVDPNGYMDPEDRERLAAEARREFYVEMGRKSAAARRAKQVVA
ncbi:hypothetical protein GCM10009859_06640 [Kocuria salsicia]